MLILAIRTVWLMLMVALLTSCGSTKLYPNTTPTHLPSTNDPNPPLQPSRQQLNRAAEINVKLGLHYLQQHNLSQAKSKLLLALEQAPQNFITHDALGYFMEITSNTAAAEKYYRQALTIAATQGKLSNSNGAAHNNYGAFLYRQQRCREALTQFTQVLADPHYLNIAAAYENAGFAALCTNDKEKAQLYFNKSKHHQLGT